MAETEDHPSVTAAVDSMARLIHFEAETARCRKETDDALMRARYDGASVALLANRTGRSKMQISQMTLRAARRQGIEGPLPRQPAGRPITTPIGVPRP